MDNERWIRKGNCPSEQCRGPRCICGEEAGCRPSSSEPGHYECICPHGSKYPTVNLTCPNRSRASTQPGAIKLYPNRLGLNSTGPQVAQASKPVSTEVLTAVTATAVLILLVFGLALFSCRKWSDAIFRRKKNRANAPLPLNKNVLVAARYAANPQYSEQVPMQEMPCIPLGVVILDRTNLKLAKELGEGCFGKVYEGDLQSDEGSSRVAIKMLKSSASREAEEDFMREVEVMSSFHNQHILTLLGIVLKDGLGAPWMVFEFMAHGDLADVLRANSVAFRRPTPGLPRLGPAALHSISQQVAAGMAYLAEQHFVHRDLACRNCLVGEGLKVKIADFGMSRDVYTCDYYKVSGARLLPIRWMSPESITYGRYTLESDVWSFGVVLWEIYSLGRQPYYGYSNEEVVKLILQESLLTPPALCPSLLADIMLSCWRREPKDRINFSDVNFLLSNAAPQSHRVYQVDLPLPPPSPPALEPVQILDADQYLLPIPMPPPEYLQTLPEP